MLRRRSNALDQAREEHDLAYIGQCEGESARAAECIERLLLA
jgi:hypothetical protein